MFWNVWGERKVPSHNIQQGFLALRLHTVDAEKQESFSIHIYLLQTIQLSLLNRTGEGLQWSCRMHVYHLRESCWHSQYCSLKALYFCMALVLFPTGVNPWFLQVEMYPRWCLCEYWWSFHGSRIGWNPEAWLDLFSFTKEFGDIEGFEYWPWIFWCVLLLWWRQLGGPRLFWVA